MYSDGAVVIDIRANQTDFDNKVKNLAKTATAALAAVGATVAGMGAAVLAVGADFESAFAGVKKTVNATDQELEQFRQGILEMSKTIPLAATEIAGIAEAAGQLGIQNENLLAFTRTMADLGVATNMTSDEAATSLARFANIVGMSQDNFDRLGSTIVDLGNNLATTESEIVSMGMRLAGAGAQIGLSESQIMGMAGALSSVGIEAEAGGTAFSTLMTKMQLAVETGTGQLESFASVAGMTTADFKKAFKEDAAGAITAFITGLGKVNETGDSAIKVLTDMNITEIRMRDALLRASGASEVFNKSMDIANAAWEENTALTKEAAQRYETTESKMQLLKNTLTETGITAFEKFKTPFKDALDTGIDSVSQLNEELGSGKLGQSVDTLADGFAGMTSTVIKLGTQALPVAVDSLSWILDHSGAIAKGASAIGTVFLAWKVTPMIKEATIAMKAFKAANVQAAATSSGFIRLSNVVGLLTGKIKLVTAATAAWKTISNPVFLGVVAAGLTALTVGWMNYHQQANSSVKKAKELTEAMIEQRKAIENTNQAANESIVLSEKQMSQADIYRDKLFENVDAEGHVIGSKEDVATAIQNLNSLLGTSITMIDEETVAMDDQVEKIQELMDMKRAEAVLNANAEGYNQYLLKGTELQEKMIDLLKERDTLQEQLEKVSLADNELRDSSLSAEAIRNLQKAKLDALQIISNMGIDPAKAQEYLDQLNLQIDETSRSYDALAKAADATKIANEAIATGDMSGLNEFLRGLKDVRTALQTDDIDKASEQVKDLSGQYDEASRKLQDYIKMTESGAMPFDENTFSTLQDRTLTARQELDDAKQILQELQDLLKATSESTGGGSISSSLLTPFSKVDLTQVPAFNIDTMREMGMQSAESYATAFNETAAAAQSEYDDSELQENRLLNAAESGMNEGTAYQTAIIQKWIETGALQIDQARADATQASNEIVAIAAGTRPPAVIIPVYYQLMNSVASVTGGGGASYDDTQAGRSVLSAFSGGAISMSDRARSAMAGLSSAVQSRSVKLDQIKYPAATGVEQKVEVNQVNHFNLPVERPSKTADKIAEVNRELGKILKGG